MLQLLWIWMDSDLISVDRGGIHEIHFDLISEWFYSTDAKDHKKTRWQKLRQKMRKQSESHLKTDYIVLYFRRCFCGYWCCFCCCVIHFAGFDHLWRLMNAIIANALNEIEIKIITHAILRLKKSKSVMKVDDLKKLVREWIQTEKRKKRTFQKWNMIS